MVEVNGFEPMASCVQGRRSPNWATPPQIVDLILNIEEIQHHCFLLFNLQSTVVGLDGFEPSTSRLSGVRSNRTELQARGNFWSQIADFGSFFFLSKIQILKSKIRLSLFSIFFLKNTPWSLKTK